KRVLAYLDTCDRAVSGQNGHNKTYWPARVVCYGFDLGEHIGFSILWKYFNPRCLPEWTEKELRHKCHDADTQSFDKPRGWLLQEKEDENAIPVRPGLSLRLRNASKNKSKITACVDVLKDGEIDDTLTITSAASNKTNAVNALLRYDHVDRNM